ncbi:hypothetical protein PGT21_003752 [Puccinia graminis f. sp. tritici]|uniref:Uncharacterized protein n=1 Tax=Puccinia graminis f. sp. tritici TaxID=56615 RepID=A0A5B0PT58_PUCGR|nr:hypothetical protein PGTUg99_018616 [Puccinia graminis f. sp. tritici]KAA1103893.1 hypothetical protein PGT21_003752 [Puccinia graminis f. sp. tritici]
MAEDPSCSNGSKVFCFSAQELKNAKGPNDSVTFVAPNESQPKSCVDLIRNRPNGPQDGVGHCCSATTLQGTGPGTGSTAQVSLAVVQAACPDTKAPTNE